MAVPTNPLFFFFVCTLSITTDGWFLKCQIHSHFSILTQLSSFKIRGSQFLNHKMPSWPLLFFFFYLNNYIFTIHSTILTISIANFLHIIKISLNIYPLLIPVCPSCLSFLSSCPSPRILHPRGHAPLCQWPTSPKNP